MNLGLIDVEGGDALQFIFHGWEGAMDKAAHAQKCAGCFAENGGGREGGYEILAACRSFSLTSSTFMRERRMVMIASNANGRIRYMIFSIAMQESG